jgi:putative ABC transport system ATP-binding protein
LAARAGLGDKLRRYPHKLSQGERQRVAICRALLAGPRLIIADEPTGNLDPRTAGGVLDLLLSEARAHDATLLVVTHDHGLLERFERVIEMEQLLAAGVAE